MKRSIRTAGIAVALLMLLNVTGCDTGSATWQNTSDTKKVTESLFANQKTPTDIDYSLERYNLIKRYNCFVESIADI